MERRDTNGDSDEEGERMDGERKQHSAEDADGDETEDKPNGEHRGSLHAKV
ncbi:hypothetical protein [Bradyrhizobium sp. SZCCHNRI3037]|uniref:hypothetical protein n=1 Tax=Bradyrhizobium sp. SZCCHNRI3037 TaxID=3057290 RepID=UPI002915C7A9|nr:hypothetical protein [Bradyrhizobium sp. SZCCHNRI3037]